MALVLLTGLCVLLYPFAGNAINKYQQQQVIRAYNKKVERQSPQQSAAVDKWIRENNRALKPTDQPVDHGAKNIDPFVDEKKATRKNAVADFKKNNEVNKLVTDVVGVLDIPKIDTNVPIYSGTSVSQLQRGAGLVKGTSIPFSGKGVHSVIAGHRGLPTSVMFRYLDKLKYGDYFFINSNGHKYAYKIDEIKVVEPKKVTDFKIDKNKNYVTLMTCTPYMVNTHRLLVRGHQVPMVKIPRGWPWWLNYVLAILAIIALALGRYFYKRHKHKLANKIVPVVLLPTPQQKESS